MLEERNNRMVLLWEIDFIFMQNLLLFDSSFSIGINSDLRKVIASPLSSTMANMSLRHSVLATFSCVCQQVNVPFFIYLLRAPVV